jgi:hypothetical protein
MQQSKLFKIILELKNETYFHGTSHRFDRVGYFFAVVFVIDSA